MGVSQFVQTLPKRKLTHDETKSQRKFLRPSVQIETGVVFDLSISELVWNPIPKPNHEDSVIRRDNAHANREGAGRFAEA